MRHIIVNLAVVLKRYLKYSYSGVLYLPESTEKEPDSPFEEEVAHELRQHGYEVEYQVGTAGFFIDLGIHHPENASEFILGIECDGATYHSAKSARDRDRIRQQVLERIGWNIYRIWSTDWFSNKEQEVAKLIQKIDWLLAKNNDGNNGVQSGGLSKLENPSFTRIPDDQSTNGNLSLPYRDAFVSNLNKLTKTYSNKHGTYSTNEALVKAFTKVESPIHREVLIKKIADRRGFGRLGRKIKSEILAAIENVENKGLVTSNDGFIFYKNSEIKVRDRSNLTPKFRDIEYIAPEEIQEALLTLLKESFGAEEKELIKKAGSLFGYSRITQNIYDVIESNLKKLGKTDQIHIEDDKIFIADID